MIETASRWLMPTLLLVMVMSSPLAAQLNLPPIPDDGYFIQDRARLIDEDARQKIGAMQKKAFEDFDTTIIVVTISEMADYGGGGMSIEHFAHEWFNH